MADDPNTTAADPVVLAARLVSLLPRLASAISRASCRQLREVTGVDYSLIDCQGVLEATGRFALAWWLDPLRALGAQAELVAHTLSLFEMHNDDGQRIQASGRGVDKRFLDTAWSEGQTLGFAKELYLFYAEWLLVQIRDCPALNDHDKQKLAFYTRQLLCALAPTNMPLINPRVRTTALETDGESLVNGCRTCSMIWSKAAGYFRLRRMTPPPLRLAAI